MPSGGLWSALALQIDPVDSPLEREADAIAARVGSSIGGPENVSGRSAGTFVQRKCAACDLEDQPHDTREEEEDGRRIQRRADAGAAAPTPMLPAADGVSAFLQSDAGRPLDPVSRGYFGSRLDADFSDVRVHTGPGAADSARSIGALAYTTGRDVVFGAGRFAPDTQAGRTLLAHELAHVEQQRGGRPSGGVTRAPDNAVQRASEGQPQAQPSPPPSAPPQTPPQTQPQAIDQAIVASTAAVIAQAVQHDDVGAAVAPLRARGLEELRVIRGGVHTETSPPIWLEHWLVERLNQASSEDTARSVVRVLFGPAAGPLAAPAPRDAARDGTAEQGVRLLWRAVPLIDRLEVYDEGFREIEQAQLDVIRSASQREKTAAMEKETRPRLDRVLALLDAREEYDAREMLDTSATGRLETANRMLARGDDDALYDAILDLPIENRRPFVMGHYAVLHRRLYEWQMTILRSMVQGSEVEALIARLRLATIDRRDDQEAVSAVIKRAVELLKERRDLQRALDAHALAGDALASAQARVEQLNTLNQLFEFTRGEKGALDEHRSFMGLVTAARGESDTFGADAKRLAEFAPDAHHYALETAKQRVLMAGKDVATLRNAIGSLHAAPVQLAVGTAAPAREYAQHEADVAFRRELLRDPDVDRVLKSLTGFNRDLTEQAVRFDEFDDIAVAVGAAYNNAQYGEFLHLIFRISQNPRWIARFEGTKHDPFDTYASVRGQMRSFMEAILETRRMPLERLLQYTGNVATLKIALDDIGEVDRQRLRTGWYLFEHPRAGHVPSTAEAEGIELYLRFTTALGASQTTLGIFDPNGYQSVLGAALGSEPTREEFGSGEGRYRTALLWSEQQQQRLGLDRGASAQFTETDETMVGAAREFAALWAHVGGKGTLNEIDFGALGFLHQRFEGRAGEFVETSNTIGEMVGMVAATVAGIVVVAATGGAATPGVIAVAAASGGGARVITRDMFGGQYYSALSDQGARDVLLGAVDAALAVVSGQLAARGAEVLGLGGHALTAQVARVAGEVAEQATQKLSTRVAASAVEAAIDGAFSGAVSETFGALTDARTWRRGIMDGLARVGQAALLGGLTGAVGGAVIGGALPVIGRGGTLLWRTVTGRSLETTLERFGRMDLLAAARQAARKGEVEEANRLARQLEEYLSDQEISALRQQIGEELTSVLRHPPGTASAADDVQRRLLAESGAMPVPSGTHLDAELDIVSRSHPQPSREPGYIEEVDLGNGHTWRRSADEKGGWCRFSELPTVCDPVPNAPKLSESAERDARVIVAKANLAEAEAANARLEKLHEDYNEIVNELGRRGRLGEKVDLTKLDARQREIIEEVTGEDIDELTMRKLQAPRLEQDVSLGRRIEKRPSPMQREAQVAMAEVRLAEQEVAAARQTWYEKLRSRSPGGTLREQIVGKAGGIDFVSKAKAATGELECDHILPLRQIADMPGFRGLEPEEQVRIANYKDNLKPVDARVNSHRQDKSWIEPFEHRNEYTEEQLAKVIEHEDKMRREIQGLIDAAHLKARPRAGPP